jgi:hypothetical protein
MLLLFKTQNILLKLYQMKNVLREGWTRYVKTILCENIFFQGILMDADELEWSWTPQKKGRWDLANILCLEIEGKVAIFGLPLK